MKSFHLDDKAKSCFATILSPVALDFNDWRNRCHYKFASEETRKVHFK